MVGDFVLAAFLRHHGAIDGCRKVAHANFWDGPDGRVVAMVMHHGGDDPKDTRYVRADLLLP